MTDVAGIVVCFPAESIPRKYRSFPGLRIVSCRDCQAELYCTPTTYEHMQNLHLDVVCPGCAEKIMAEWQSKGVGIAIVTDPETRAEVRRWGERN